MQSRLRPEGSMPTPQEPCTKDRKDSMSSRAKKFIARAPRYTLNASDKRFMRYAFQNDQGHSFTTSFIDLSQTGIAFVTDRENAPQLSDLIKVEIPLSPTETVAWWARVVRVEEYKPEKWHKQNESFKDENQVLVAIHFHELPPGHAQIIRETLNKKFDELYKSKRRKQFENLALLFVSRFWSMLLYGLCIFATFYFLYYFSRPSSNYDPNKGAPWGQRFPSLNWGPSSDRE